MWPSRDSHLPPRENSRAKFVHVNMAAGSLSSALQLSKRTVFSLLCFSNRRNISPKSWKKCSSNAEPGSPACKVLYLNCSGSNKLSFTGETAREFLAQYTELHPEHLVEEIQLWDRELLSFDLSHVESRMRAVSGQETADDDMKLVAVQKMTSQLLSASKVVISCPMWNYSVPYVLKQYIDCVVQSDLTFRETENGPEGLVTGRPLLLITSSSSDFSKEPMRLLDFQVPYLKAIFGFIGFQDFHHIYIANTNTIRRKELMKYAKQRIIEEVVSF